MIKTVTKDDLIELGFAPGTARKIIHTGKLLLVNRGFNILIIIRPSVVWRCLHAKQHNTVLRLL